MFLDFVEIGTSDFDTEIQKRDNRVGLSIEPITYYLDRLPDKLGCKKLPLAISDRDGKATVFYVSEENIVKFGLPGWARGCNSIGDYHPTIKRELSKRGISIEDIATSYEVPVSTLVNVLDEEGVSGLYFLKIDTEGHDTVILRRFLEDNRPDLLPHLLLFESNVLSNSEAVFDTISKFSELGYDLVRRDVDTVMRLNLRRFSEKISFGDPIENHYIQDYPPGYDIRRLPHENTLEDAMKWCLEGKHSGITYQDGIYQVRAGKYMMPYHESTTRLVSWLLL